MDKPDDTPIPTHLHDCLDMHALPAALRAGDIDFLDALALAPYIEEKTLMNRAVTSENYRQRQRAQLELEAWKQKRALRRSKPRNRTPRETA